MSALKWEALLIFTDPKKLFISLDEGGSITQRHNKSSKVSLYFLQTGSFDNFWYSWISLSDSWIGPSQAQVWWKKSNKICQPLILILQVVFSSYMYLYATLL